MKLHNIDEFTLTAYLDGELDAQACETVENALTHDAELRAALNGLRQVDSVLIAALKPALTEQPPDNFQAAPARTSARPERQRPSAFPWPSLAAAFAALAVGLGVGTTWLSPRQDFDDAFRQQMSHALETQHSGQTVSWTRQDSGIDGTLTPVRTWQSTSGEFCREYRAALTRWTSTRSERGIACRVLDGEWRVKVRYFD